MDFNVFNCGTKEQQVFLAIDALFDEIPNGLSMLLASQIIRLSNSYKLNQIFLMTSDQRISNLARAWKCKELNRIDHFQLHRIKADNALIDEWLATIPANNQELHLEFYDYIPEKYLSQYAKLFSQFVNEMPKEKEFDKSFILSEEKIVNEEKWASENNWFRYSYYLFDSKNRIIGLSRAIIDGNNPYDVYQGMTGIVKEYRGRGLSKWLKAEVYKKVGEDFPENEIMTTEMRAVNVPIQRVNEQMGFELVKQGNEFEVRLTDLEEFLKANK